MKNNRLLCAHKLTDGFVAAPTCRPHERYGLREQALWPASRSGKKPLRRAAWYWRRVVGSRFGVFRIGQFQQAGMDRRSPCWPPRGKMSPKVVSSPLGTTAPAQSPGLLPARNRHRCLCAATLRGRRDLPLRVRLSEGLGVALRRLRSLAVVVVNGCLRAEQLPQPRRPWLACVDADLVGVGVLADLRVLDI